MTPILFIDPDNFTAMHLLTGTYIPEFNTMCLTKATTIFYNEILFITIMQGEI